METETDLHDVYNSNTNVDQAEEDDELILDVPEKKIVTVDATFTELGKGTGRTTIVGLTQFEIPRAIGVRAQQLACGAPPLVDPGDLTSTIDIAKKELKEGKLPLIIRRYLPDGTYEDVRVSDYSC